MMPVWRIQGHPNPMPGRFGPAIRRESHQNRPKIADDLKVELQTQAPQIEGKAEGRMQNAEKDPWGRRVDGLYKASTKPGQGLYRARTSGEHGVYRACTERVQGLYKAVQGVNKACTRLPQSVGGVY